MIQIRNLSKTYHIKTGDVKALDGVSLDIAAGDIYGVIGYSGAGKSTLVRCLNLLEIPDAGSVTVDGTPTNSAEFPAVYFPWRSRQFSRK